MDKCCYCNKKVILGYDDGWHSVGACIREVITNFNMSNIIKCWLLQVLTVQREDFV